MQGHLNVGSSQAPALWINPEHGGQALGAVVGNITINDVLLAEQRLARFAPLLEKLFPELEKSAGIVESPLLALPADVIAQGADAQGTFWVKADHQLAVAGSVKARGGFHEVLEFAEKIALETGMLKDGDGYEQLASTAARECFARYEVAVGSTGNLGMSIGIMSAALGFKASVHMSAEAKEWKKRLLRSHGVTVHEYPGDYAQAVATGRELARGNPFSHFVDDEKSASLFCGYAVAALRLQRQLIALNVRVDRDHPLFVYIPCGVGGAPGGVCYGLKHVFGEHVHCFFVEPEDSSCFLVRMQNPDVEGISIYDAGQHNQTIADGLAVPQASELVYSMMRTRLAGMVVASDERMVMDLWRLKSMADLKVEPSAAAAVSGPRALLGTVVGQQYLHSTGLDAFMPAANHIVWTTGGALMPADEFDRLFAQGLELSSQPQANVPDAA
ncbi:D-serine ammonia-lyase [Diaphorobacter sp. HDW4A]|uniref:D-serine ammonia-lyase n=1 Tax=Diaphorobacter sp. HDW4A TaxID=2714924 RepID=UPI00140C0BB6|nr:D-serine ammonia-lyase [Diaphorobacter sp. HDW4A]QIL80741.1 D-serine ammonia-lyase [Diaphorobacter sp. HDW4A]